MSSRQQAGIHFILCRTYYPAAVNGQLYCNGIFQCNTIELPWRFNQTQRSCIPEGTYRLQKRFSPKHKAHLLVTGVPNRSLILLHPANNAPLELRGCIAPVTNLTGVGTGTGSNRAMIKIMSLLHPSMKNETIYLTIKQNNNEYSQKNESPHP